MIQYSEVAATLNIITIRWHKRYGDASQCLSCVRKLLADSVQDIDGLMKSVLLFVALFVEKDQLQLDHLASCTPQLTPTFYF